jgi:CO/xanthine dehydrogenase FAD-binding subunit
MALDAMIEIASVDGVREVGLADFFTADGIWNTRRQPHEIVTQVRVPKPSPRLRMSYQKLRERKAVDFPILSLALAVEFGDDVVVDSIALVVSALGAKPRTIGGLDKIVVGERLSADAIEEIASQAHRQCNPLDNLIVEIEWRRAMVPVFVRRAFREILDGDIAAAWT